MALMSGIDGVALMNRKNATSRRSFITGLAASLGSALVPAVSSWPAGAAGAKKDFPSLGGAAQKAGLLFGASASREIFGDPAYAALYQRHARIITTDVALKFDYLRWQGEKHWDFAEADHLLLFARNNEMKMRGHCLIWNENAPQWLRRRPARELGRIMDEHIERVMERYIGQLHSIDVINEPFWPGHGIKGGYRNGPWLEALGPSYISRALKRAAAIDPETILCINEAHCERNDEVGRAIRKDLLALIIRLQDEGTPIDAIGLQGHLLPAKPYDDSVFEDFLWKIHERGLNIFISEMDVDDSPFPAAPGRRDEQVAKRYGDFLQKVLKVPSVRAVICWQLADKYSWYAHLAKREGRRPPRPLPFDAALTPKPAARALLDAFGNRPQP